MKFGRVIILGMPALCLSNCSATYSESQISCINSLEYKLKSPSSLKLIRVSSMEQFFYPEEFTRQYGEPEQSLEYSEFDGKKGIWVRFDMIEYDASNSFGAMLRNNEHCYTAPLLDGSRQVLFLNPSSGSVDIPQTRIRVTGF